jgi:hypothetical protein
VIDEFYIKPRKLNHPVIDREATAIVKHER